MSKVNGVREGRGNGCSVCNWHFYLHKHGLHGKTSPNWEARAVLLPLLLDRQHHGKLKLRQQGASSWPPSSPYKRDKPPARKGKRMSGCPSHFSFFFVFLFLCCSSGCLRVMVLPVLALAAACCCCACDEVEGCDGDQ